MTALTGDGTLAAERPAGSLKYVLDFATIAERNGLCDGFGQGRRVGAADGLDGRAVVEDLERGHGSDALRAGDVGLVVDVDLGKGHLVRARVLLGEALKVRRNHLAGTAPIGIEICDDDGGSRQQRLPLAVGSDVDGAAHCEDALVDTGRFYCCELRLCCW